MRMLVASRRASVVSKSRVTGHSNSLSFCLLELLPAYPLTPLNSLRDLRPGRCHPRLEVELRPLIEYVQFQPNQTDRIVFPDPGHGGELQPRRVHDGERPTPHHLQQLIRADERRGVLV